ncbi:hypothetical protein LPJ53_006337 [Coemansia erecta]|uniref:Uncharacterized protein n=1 Tax=Coemansia erecta TaxID=147472 RepID=A0A9W7XSX7_9FUNG|nr:hypothetical protein LPJ53_006337 [Coemansia erecta]
MLDKLPSSVIQAIGRYLRAWTYAQPSLTAYAHTSRRIYSLVIRQAYEYFTLTDVILPSTLHPISHWLPRFAAVQRHLTRVLISDSAKIPAEAWARALDALDTSSLSWAHVRMLSFEIDGVRDSEGGVVAEMLVQFAKKHLAHVDELWLGVDGRLRFFDAGSDEPGSFSGVTELRVIGRHTAAARYSVPDALPAMPHLTTVHLDAAACQLTTLGALVCRQHQTLTTLSIDTYSAALAHALQLCMTSPWLEYPALHKLTLSIASSPTHNDPPGLLDSRRVPRLALLSSSHAQYPVGASGQHHLRDRPSAQLLAQPFAGLRVLAVDALTLGDVHHVGSAAGHTLEALSIGGLFTDVRLAAEGPDGADAGAFTPAVCLTSQAMAHVLRTCGGLQDLRLLVPPAYEDAYNGMPGPDTPGCVFERPAMALPVEWPVHSGLRHVCIHAWAMSFDQALGLARRLPRLASLDWVLRMAHARDGQIGEYGAQSLAHVSVAHTAPVRLKHAFKAALLRFAAALQGPLRVLDVYGALVVPGLAGAVGRVAPGCAATFYPLVPSWADASEEEDDEDEDDSDGRGVSSTSNAD